MIRRRCWSRGWEVSLFVVLLLPACAHGPAVRSPVSALSPDSLALLNEALQQVRPAYSAQRDALRAGVYGERRPPDPSGRRRTAPHVLGTAMVEGPFVIQIAAYREEATAEAAAREAQRLFPSLRTIVEAHGGYHRIAFTGWQNSSAAEAELRAVRRIYPGAWVRRRAVP
jgi:hypothetical protein